MIKLQYSPLAGSSTCFDHYISARWLRQVAEAVVAAWESGELQSALGSPEAYKAWVKALGKAQKRKGKRLFMPLRVALTGNTHVRLCCPDAAPD